MIDINIDIKDIKNIPLFSSLNSEQLNKLSRGVYFQEFESGEIIFVEGEPSREFFIILSGEIQIIKESVDGKEKVLKILQVGDFFGEMGVIEDKNRSATALVNVSARILVLGKQTFLAYIRENPDAAFKMIVELSNRLRLADREIENLAFLKVEERLKKLFLRLADNEGKRPAVSKDLTHKEIAKMIGSSRETVTRMLNRLTKKEMIEIIDSKIYLNFK